MQKPIFAACAFTVLFLLTSNKDFIDNTAEINREVFCLAKNIYHEAASESFEGKSAVSQVVLTRLNDPRFPKTICEVVYQNNGRTYQFSWTGMKERKITNQFAWEESLYIAKKSVLGETVHPKLEERNALFYHADYVFPKWKLRKVTTIGRHIFYTEYRT